MFKIITKLSPKTENIEIETLKNKIVAFLSNQLMELESNLQYLAENGHCREIFHLEFGAILTRNEPEIVTTEEYDKVFEMIENTKLLLSKFK
jgi:hypothetical protein